jgi:GT2 family glycosyltransferase
LEIGYSVNITAYVPCYNAERYVAAAIQGLLAQTRPPDEVLIIDDGSIDSTVELASSFPVRVICHDSNKGLAAARNTAFRHAQYPLVAAVDADAVPARDWLERLYHKFTDDNVAAAGGRLIEYFHDTPADCWRCMHLPQGGGEEGIEITWPSEFRLSGFGTLLRKSAVERVGGYDERYRTNYEDHDMCGKLLRAGYTLVYEPDAIVRHMKQDSIYSVLRNAWNWNFWGLYYKGHYNRVLRKVLSNFHASLKCIRQHWKCRRPSLWLIDAILPFLHSYWDLRYYFSSERLPAPPAENLDEAR